jgi:hypothetical protein
MRPRFMYRALAGTALSIALGPFLAGTTSAHLPSSSTAEALQLALPAAPSSCNVRTRTTTYRDRRKGIHYRYSYSTVSWRDNSSDEEGFVVEEWRSQSGTWVLARAISVPPNSTALEAYDTPEYRYRVKAFNASGDSAWSNWSR